MKKLITDYIFIDRKKINDDYCNSLIKELNKHIFKDSLFYDPKNKKYFSPSGKKTYKTVEEKIKNADELINLIQLSIEKYLKKLNFSWFSNIINFTYPKFHKYSKGNLMIKHCDHIRYIFDGKNKGVPILTIIGILNDDFKGGQTFLCDKDLKFFKGDILIFPSNFLYPHEIKEIKKGIRYSFISWAW